jgi:hypothetical protein
VRADTEKNLHRIKRASAVLGAICKVLLGLSMLLFLAAVASVLIGRGVTVNFSEVFIPVEPLAMPARLILIAILALSMGVMFKGLYHLQRLFSDYARGEIFTTRTAGQIRQLGITAILWACVGIIWAVAAFGFAPTRHPMSFQLHLDFIFTGVVIIVISWFMDAAAEIREENDLTI